jgi:hypothetical protein
VRQCFGCLDEDLPKATPGLPPKRKAILAANGGKEASERGAKFAAMRNAMHDLDDRLHGFADGAGREIVRL